MNYQWDGAKARFNLQKHGIDFTDAVGVFEDEWAFTCKEEEIAGEFRFITLDMDFLDRIVGCWATLKLAVHESPLGTAIAKGGLSR